MVSSEENEPLVTHHQQNATYGSGGFRDNGNQNNHNGVTKPDLTRRGTETIIPGSRDVLSAKYESLDYDICENTVLLEEVRRSGYNFAVHKMLSRWFIFFLIGLLTALIGVFIDISIDKLASYKYGLIKAAIDQSVIEATLWRPYLIWASLNVGFILIGSFLVAYLEPIASGSGIPPIKCYLNGINVPRVVRLKTLFVKVVGVICSVVGGLAAGKEGPMIHTGAVVAAGISQGKSTSLNMDFNVFRYFREDHEKRDFVSGGAAAGVAAAFGAPIGGVLFSLEEGSSFWNQSLTWRIFFASSVSVFTLNTILSSYHGHPGELFYYGLLNFGHFDSIYYHYFELILFAFMGAIGGFLGAFYTFINLKLTVFRMRYVRSRWMKVIEACLVASSTATIAMLMVYLISDCRPLGEDPTENPIQMFCGDGQYSAVAALWLQNPENSVRALFHDPANSQNLFTLFVFTTIYLFLSIWTYGLSVSAGIFIPCLLTGAGWGRIIGISLRYFLPEADWVDPGKYSLIGAAAQLGGVVRMTISLTIILIEATGNINFGLPLMVTVMVAKWVGDYFTEGFYDLHIQLGGIPLLPWDPPEKSIDLPAREVMNYPVITLSPIEKVGTIVNILLSKTYNGFPVVDTSTLRRNQGGTPTYGKLSGLILRSQLIVLLQNRAYIETSGPSTPTVPMSEFRHKYPRYKQIKDIFISDDEMNYTVDLKPYMNPSPYTVQEVASLPRIFRLFRALGLRHLIVVNNSNEVIGMVTRKDIARYRVKAHRSLEVEELRISDKF